MKEYHYLVTLDVTSSAPLDDPGSSFLSDLVSAVDSDDSAILGELLVTRIHHPKYAPKSTVFRAMKKALVIHSDRLKEQSAEW